jgi:hypothetical protein
MEVKTKVGVQVEVRANGSSKIMAFDKPIRSIELTNDESAHIGTLLAMDVKIGITSELRKLLIENFFFSSRSFRDIKGQLQKKGIEAKSASLNTILGKMVERQELIRTGTRGAYLYQKNKERARSH